VYGNFLGCSAGIEVYSTGVGLKSLPYRGSPIFKKKKKKTLQSIILCKPLFDMNQLKIASFHFKLNNEINSLRI
jgi:hypothetical protein